MDDPFLFGRSLYSFRKKVKFVQKTPKLNINMSQLMNYVQIGIPELQIFLTLACNEIIMLLKESWLPWLWFNT